MTTNTLTIKDITIEYTTAGNKADDTLLFIHGLGGNLRQWEDQITYFSKAHHCIALSLVGHGHSTKSETIDDYSIDAYCSTVLALLKQLEVSSCTVIGNSMGGVIGYELIKREPTLVRKLITNGTTPRLQTGAATKRFIYLMDKLLIGILGYEKYINIAVNASLKDTDKRQTLKSLFMAASPYAVIQSHQILSDYDYLNIIARADVPVVIIRTPGDKDINKHIQKVQVRLNDYNNVTVLDLAEGGHVFNIELPDLYNEQLQLLL